MSAGKAERVLLPVALGVLLLLSWHYAVLWTE